MFFSLNLRKAYGLNVINDKRKLWSRHSFDREKTKNNNRKKDASMSSFSVQRSCLCQFGVYKSSVSHAMLLKKRVAAFTAQVTRS